ncbi:helix-turn-helix domain-containing protein [Tsukamurella tyrosinosolvens]|uniref:AraC-like ligand-binding domain-containing protein n=1 Tax=Tsukamurella tyrosinosolvens TaxID=57704 RepID=UPI001AF1A70F|nr:helix-turn-helix domain-containing protein [Tsukamurella tyrosinosolvens]QRY82643.1 helix-turn-helix domain-containing protein [Tsukamurella tyrosinosolvens]
MSSGAVEVFDAATLAAPDRFDAWQEAVNTAFVPLRAAPHPDGTSSPVLPSPRRAALDGAGSASSFRGLVRSQDLGAAAATEVAGGPVTVWRDRGTIADADPGVYKLGVQLQGYSVLTQDGREAALTPGDLAIYDTTRAYSLDFADDFSMFVLLIPRDRLGLTPRQVAGLTAQRISGRHGLGALASSLLTGLGRQLRTGGVDPDPRAVHAVLELVDATLMRRLEPAEAVPTADVVFAGATAYIDAHLGLPGLSVEAVAAAQHVSVRYLQQLFAERGSTPSAWIRRRRIDAVSAALADPAQAVRPVAAIGAQWGFPDPSGFARAFKSATGTSPGEYRARHLGPAVG